MPIVSASISNERERDLDYILEKANLFLQLNDIPLEITKSRLISDLIEKEAKRLRDIHNDDPTS